MSDSKEYKYTYIGKLVTRDGTFEKDGKKQKYTSSRLVFGNRYYPQDSKDGKYKKGDVIPPINLSKEEEKKIKDLLFDYDLYLFEPNDTAPDFIKKYIAVKAEDLKDDKEEDDVVF